MYNIIDKLKSKRVRSSTSKNYLNIWRIFNKFLIRLDNKPGSWEERIYLFAAYLIDRGNKSNTIASYISAVKGVLKDDGYEWDENKALLSTLTRACKLVNDVVKVRLPIQKRLLELILFENQRILAGQPFLAVLFEAIFCLGYYGLMRIGELTEGDHPIKAKDVHIAMNKNKILIVLYSSKTHSISNYPQQIKIEALVNRNKSFFCPFMAVRNYLQERGAQYENNAENFFVFRDKTPVKPVHVRNNLNACISSLGLNPKDYNTMSFRSGRASDMAKSGRFSIDQIKTAGRWKSGAVYRYLRN